MIHIEKDQEIWGNENLRVAAPTGDYEDTARIEFYDISNPGISPGSFEAQYIKYGNLVYRFNDPKELGAEILKIDPASAHMAASFARMSNDLSDMMNDGSLETTSLESALTNEKSKSKNNVSNPVAPPTNNGTTSPPTNNPSPPTNTATTTQPTSSVISTPATASPDVLEADGVTNPVVPPTNTSTTTPPTNTSTTTPPAAFDVSTTTEVIPAALEADIDLTASSSAP